MLAARKSIRIEPTTNLKAIPSETGREVHNAPQCPLVKHDINVRSFMCCRRWKRNCETSIDYHATFRITRSVEIIPPITE